MNRLSTLGFAVALCAASFVSLAQTAAPAAKPAAKGPAATKKAAPAPAAAAEPVAASPAQLAAAERVFYGTYLCEFDKSVQVSSIPKFPGYAELRFGKSVYVMKPVASETGAIRLEDVKGETLVIQIANKSMLLNVKSGQRLLDGCVSEKHTKVAAAAS
ncbi:MAG: hypothetical protein ABL916_17345 [Burkholderiaceae bacterium]